MPRPVLGAVALAATLGAGLILASPGIAQASHAVPDGVISWFSGYTFPDTAAGYSACVAKGVYERTHTDVWNYSCWLGNPDAGVYNLWLSDLT
jgi:hypothetical protein